MATEFLMPKLGLTMEEGTIAEWLVADGETVESGTPVLRIETDKTETDVEAAFSGRLQVEGQVGDTFACGERIGWFLADGEDAQAASVAPAAAATPAPAAPSAAVAPVPTPGAAHVASGGRIIASPMAKRLAKERGIDLRTIRGTGPGGRIVNADLEGVSVTPTATTAAPRPASAGASVAATAAARQLADLLGVDLAAVPADPTDGRVTRDGVAQYVRTLIGTSPGTGAAPQATPTASPALPPAMQTPTSVTKLSGMRGTIAKRMHESLSEMAQLTLFMDADIDAVVTDRDRRKAEGRAPSYTDYVIAAAAPRAPPAPPCQLPDHR